MNSYLTVALFMSLLFASSRAGAQSKTLAERSISVAVAGDMLGPFHRLDDDPGLSKVAALLQSTDVGFANAEVSTFDLSLFTGFPAAETGGGYPLQQPGIAADVRNLGISLVSKANNHATDYGSEGLVATLTSLAKAGFVTGGAGFSDAEARRPAYLKTPNGIVALVATASTFTPSEVAGAAVQRPEGKSRPRPGINPLHVRQVRRVTSEIFEQLKVAAGPLATYEGSALRISDQMFEVAEEVGFRWEIEPADMQANLAAVQEARAHADLVIFSIHAHETAGNQEEAPSLPYQSTVLNHADEAPSPNDPRPASFEPKLFHAAVDHGADLVIRHGPHVLGGIEIYKGKPIFYSLGSLFVDFGGRRVLDTPGGQKLKVPDEWFEGLVPVCAFEGGRLRECKLYPIEINKEPGSRSGDPRLAHGERARIILDRLRRLSRDFGTNIDIQGDIGLLHESTR